MANTLRICALACFLFSPLASAEGDEPATVPSFPTVSNVKGTDLREVITSVSQRTHKKFLIDPRVRATVDLVGIDTREVTYPLLLTICRGARSIGATS